MHKAVLHRVFFQRILGAFPRNARTNDETSMHLFPRRNDSWVAVILPLNLLHLLSFYSQGLYNRCGKPSFLRVRPNIYPAVKNNALFFFEKVFLKGTSPVYGSLQQHKPVLPLIYVFLLGV